MHLSVYLISRSSQYVKHLPWHPASSRLYVAYLSIGSS
nr:MAG TPA: hypothetical protein [Caudoviricetes sp.]